MPTTSGLGSAQTSQTASATLTRTVPAPFDPNATATATVEGLTITLTKHLSVTGFPIAGQFDVFVSGPDADAELGTAQIPPRLVLHPPGQFWLLDPGVQHRQ